MAAPSRFETVVNAGREGASGGQAVLHSLELCAMTAIDAPVLSRVIPPAAPRVTSADPLDRPPRSAGGAVFVDRVDRVLAATRMEPAMTSHDPAEGGSVQHDYEDEHAAHHQIIA